MDSDKGEITVDTRHLIWRSIMQIIKNIASWTDIYLFGVASPHVAAG